MSLLYSHLTAMREAFHPLSMPAPLWQPLPLLHPLPGFLWLHLCPLDGLRPVPEPDSVLFLSLSLTLWLHQRAHNFKLALDATSEGLATREEGVGGGVGSASVATFHSYGLAEISPAPAPAPS